MTTDDNQMTRKTILASGAWFRKLDEDGNPIVEPTTFARGGIVSDRFIETATGSPVHTWTPTTTTTTLFPRTAVTRTPTTPPPEHELGKAIEAPTKQPKKIVLAFLDEDDNPEWCAMVYPDSVDVQHRLLEPSEMQIAFKLIDANKAAEE